MKVIEIITIFLFCTSCQKKVGFEITNEINEYTFKVDLRKVGDPSKMHKRIISYWDDTIIWKGIKLAPTIDTIIIDQSQNYYGMDSVQKFEKYKAKNWYIKHEYLFYSW